MPEPTLVAYAQSDWSDITSATETAGPFTWLAGDSFYVFGGTEDDGVTLNTPTVTGLTFALIDSSAGASNARCYYWKATAAAGGSGSISATTNGSSSARGLAVWQYRDSDGSGTPVTINNSTAKTISVNRGQANSHILQLLIDWNQTGDVTTDATPAPNATQRVEQAVSGRADFFATDWGDQGGTGTTAYGITNHTGTVDMVGIAVEILGTGGGGTPTLAARRSLLGVGV